MENHFFNFTFLLPADVARRTCYLMVNKTISVIKAIGIDYFSAANIFKIAFRRPFSFALFCHFFVAVDNNREWKRKIRYAVLNYNVNAGEEPEFESELGRGNGKRWPRKLMFLIELPAGVNWFVDGVIYAKSVELCNLVSARSIMIALSWSRNCSSMTRSTWSNTQSIQFESRNWLSLDHVRLTFFFLQTVQCFLFTPASDALMRFTLKR